MEIYRINFSYEVVTRYNATLDIEAEDVANAAEIVQNDYKSGKCILDYNPTEDASIPLEYKDIISMEIIALESCVDRPFMGRGITHLSQQTIIKLAESGSKLNIVVYNLNISYQIMRNGRKDKYITISKRIISSEESFISKKINVCNEDISHALNRILDKKLYKVFIFYKGE